jgi:hypothetical protein
MEEILSATAATGLRICHLTIYDREVQPETSHVSARYDSRTGLHSIPSPTCAHVGTEPPGGFGWLVGSHLSACWPRDPYRSTSKTVVGRPGQSIQPTQGMPTNHVPEIQEVLKRCPVPPNTDIATEHYPMRRVKNQPSSGRSARCGQTGQGRIVDQESARFRQQENRQKMLNKRRRARP